MMMEKGVLKKRIGKNENLNGKKDRVEELQ